MGYAVLSKYMSRRTTMLTAVLTLGVAMTVIAFLPPLPMILVLCAVVGLVYGPIAPIYNYVMQTRAPKHLRGRVVGVMGSLAYAAGPLGLIVAGPLADAAGLHATFLALSLPMLLLGVVAVFLPALQELDRPPPADSQAEPARPERPGLARRGRTRPSDRGQFLAGAGPDALAGAVHVTLDAAHGHHQPVGDLTVGQARPGRVRRSRADVRSRAGWPGCATPVCTGHRTRR